MYVPNALFPEGEGKLAKVPCHNSGEREGSIMRCHRKSCKKRLTNYSHGTKLLEWLTPNIPLADKQGNVFDVPLCVLCLCLYFKENNNVSLIVRNYLIPIIETNGK
jgi:hypothetical protein